MLNNLHSPLSIHPSICLSIFPSIYLSILCMFSFFSCCFYCKYTMKWIQANVYENGNILMRKESWLFSSVQFKWADTHSDSFYFIIIYLWWSWSWWILIDYVQVVRHWNTFGDACEKTHIHTHNFTIHDKRITWHLIALL